MTDKDKDSREAFEQWLNKTIDCKYEYDPVCGYLPQEVYQLHQAFMAGQRAATPCAEVVDAIKRLIVGAEIEKADALCYSDTEGAMFQAGCITAYRSVLGLLEKNREGG